MKKFFGDVRGEAIIALIFVSFLSAAAGATAYGTVPEVKKVVDKVIIGAEHAPAINEDLNDGVEKR